MIQGFLIQIKYFYHSQDIGKALGCEPESAHSQKKNTLRGQCLFDLFRIGSYFGENFKEYFTFYGAVFSQYTF